jgi:putative transposase
MTKLEHYHTKFEEGNFYHIYNRTVDKQPMFRSDANYEYFLKKYDEYLSPVIDTYAYCLLGNHFHLLIHVQEI